MDNRDTASDARIDTQLPIDTHELVKSIVESQDCSRPVNSTTLYPQWGQEHITGMYQLLMRSYFNQLGRVTDYCPTDPAAPHEDWCPTA